MKKIFILPILIFSVMKSFAAYNYTSTNPYKARSFNEKVQLVRLAKEVQELKEIRYKEYTTMAYEFLKQNDYNNFIYYSDLALKTGWYHSKLYYDRGIAYMNSGHFKTALKELKKAEKEGYSQATKAIEACKIIMKNNR